MKTRKVKKEGERANPKGNETLVVDRVMAAGPGWVVLYPEDERRIKAEAERRMRAHFGDAEYDGLDRGK